jgi:hypothetical protein
MVDIQPDSGGFSTINSVATWAMPASMRVAADEFHATSVEALLSHTIKPVNHYSAQPSIAEAGLAPASMCKGRRLHIRNLVFELS